MLGSTLWINRKCFTTIQNQAWLVHQPVWTHCSRYESLPPAESRIQSSCSSRQPSSYFWDWVVAGHEKGNVLGTCTRDWWLQIAQNRCWKLTICGEKLIRRNVHKKVKENLSNHRQWRSLVCVIGSSLSWGMLLCSLRGTNLGGRYCCVLCEVRT